MRKTAILLVIFLFAFLSAGLLFSQKNDEDGKFQKILDSYFDELWKFYPTTGTMAGYHKYDAKLEDFSSSNLGKRLTSLDAFNKDFVTKVNKMGLSPDCQIDHEMILDALDLEILKHENLVPWEFNPLLYNDIFANCIQSLFSKEFAPIEARAKSAELRLKDLPGLIKQAKDNLKTPPQIYTETAISQFSGIMNFYKNELPPLLEQTPADIKPRLKDNLAKLIPVLEDYQNFLKNVLLPRSTGNFRLGQEVHTRLLRDMLQSSIPIQELIERSKADYRNIKNRMFFTCVPFYEIMDPKIDLQKPPPNLSEDQLYNTVIDHVLTRLKSEHVSKEEYISRIKVSAEEIKKFISENQLLDLPADNLNIEPMPAAYQGVTWTRLISPGAYETSGPYTVQVTPIPESWKEDQTKSFLEEYNNLLLYTWTAHKVYPGSFIPLISTRKNPSLVRKLYANQPLIKAWPIFVSETLLRGGFHLYDTRLRLHRLMLLLQAVINFQMELNVHEGGYEKEKVIAYMTTGFQTQDEAERKWKQILLKPAENAFVYVGYQEILDIQKEYRKLKGESYNQKEFLSRLLSYGALSLRQLRNKMLSQ
jgi:uncharacterized protein (DUF885 family)